MNDQTLEPDGTDQNGNINIDYWRTLASQYLASSLAKYPELNVVSQSALLDVYLEGFKQAKQIMLDAQKTTEVPF